MSRRPLLAVLGAILVGALAVPAGAEEADGADGELDLSVRDSTFDPDGSVELVVNVTGSAKPDIVDPGAFSVSENGLVVEDLEVTPQLETEATEVVASLVIDVSGSMAGQPLEETQQAAVETVETLTAEQIPVGLLAFATEVQVLSAPVLDAGALTDRIVGLEAEGDTALFDAVVAGVEQLREVEGVPNLVVFADGEDNASAVGSEEAIRVAVEAGVPVTVVAFETDSFQPETVAPLAEGTEGRLMVAEDVADFGEVFADVATDIASQYVVTYQGAASDADSLDVELSVATGGAERSHSFTVPNPRETSEELATPTVTTTTGDSPGVLGTTPALAVGLAAAFLAVLLLFGLVLTTQRSPADRVLADQLERYLERGDQRAGRSTMVATHFRERAMHLLESTPRPEGFDERLRLRLEQAAWPLRNSEFLLLCLGSALAAGLLGGIGANWLGGVLLALVAGAVPWIVLAIRRSRRRDAFLRSLPDTLQLMAGSLRAGYGVLQALDTVAKEATGPVAEEFQRVITEARLGMPVEEALEAMAERTGSEDFRWVVLAINIQREVGGNLAELLDTVAETLRERESLRRQIQVLSAEGKLSAIVLIALPIVLTIYLVLVRPEYISTLVTSGPLGWLMIIAAGSLMLVGVIWIRKLIQIEV